MAQTIAEKIFASHLVDSQFEGTFVLSLDRVFCHEITTPVAIVDLAAKNKDSVFSSEKIKAVIDHVTPAKDSKTALQGKILRDWAHRNNIRDFFDIGQNGVCHAIFPEKGFARQCACRGACRTHQMDCAAFSHSTIKIAVCGRGANFAFGKHAVTHAQTRAASGIGYTKARFHKHGD